MNTKTLSSLIGGALGDALGYSREFNQLADIKKCLPSGHWDLADFNNAPAALYDDEHKSLISDDTQMTIATGRALIAARGYHSDSYTTAVANQLSQHYVTWSKHPDNNRAPGNACMRACRNMAKGLHWSNATDINTMGCGANMRVAPIALNTAPGSLIDLAYLSSAVTHAHPAALASAALTVAAIQAAYNGMQGTEILDFLIDMCRNPGQYPHDVLGDLYNQSEYGSSPEAYLRVGYEVCKGYLLSARTALHLGWKGDTDPCEITGQAWTAPEALAGAVLCVAGLWDEPVKVLQRAAVSNGDSDSLAAIAGNIRGAAGVEWPSGWVFQLETKPVNELYKLAEQL